MASYSYTKQVNVSRLEVEIQNSAIITALDYINLEGADDLEIVFKASLSGSDEIILDGIVADHINEPLPEAPQIVTIDEPKDTDGSPLIKTKPLADTDNLVFRGQGIQGTALKATMDGETLLPTTTDIDFLVPEDRLINGTRVMLKNHHFDDYGQLMIFDLDNILGFGSGVLLNHFAIDWNFVSTEEDQGFFILPYPAKLYSGLYVRLRYTAHNTAEDVKIKINYVLHKKQS